MAIPQNSIGTVLRLNIKTSQYVEGATSRIPFDISLATTKQIIITKPSGTVLTKTAEFTNDGVDGKIQYATIEDDLDELKEYKIRGRVVIGTKDLPTSTKRFYVEV